MIKIGSIVDVRGFLVATQDAHLLRSILGAGLGFPSTSSSPSRSRSPARLPLLSRRHRRALMAFFACVFTLFFASSYVRDFIVVRLHKRFASIIISSWLQLVISALRATQKYCAFAMCLLFVGLCMGFDIVAACALVAERCRAHAVLHFRADA